MSRYAEVVNRRDCMKVWRFFASEETLKEVKKQNSWRTDLSAIVIADNAPDDAESGWIYDPGTGEFIEPMSSEPVGKQLNDLDKRFRNRLERLSLAYVGAVMDGDVKNQERLKAERVAMIQSYLSKRSKIVGV